MRWTAWSSLQDTTRLRMLFVKRLLAAFWSSQPKPTELPELIEFGKNGYVISRADDFEQMTSCIKKLSVNDKLPETHSLLRWGKSN